MSPASGSQSPDESELEGQPSKQPNPLSSMGTASKSKAGQINAADTTARSGPDATSAKATGLGEKESQFDSLLKIYLAIGFCFSLYWYWERNDGKIFSFNSRTTAWEEFLLSRRGLFWPYYMGKNQYLTKPFQDNLGTLEHFKASTEAILKGRALWPRGNGTMTWDQMEPILRHYKLALDEAKKVTPTDLVVIHKDASDKFIKLYQRGLSIYFEGVEKKDRALMNEGEVLLYEWGIFYRTSISRQDPLP